MANKRLFTQITATLINKFCGKRSIKLYNIDITNNLREVSLHNELEDAYEAIITGDKEIDINKLFTITKTLALVASCENIERYKEEFISYIEENRNKWEEHL